MAKKKEQKEVKKNKFKYNTELMGVIFLLLSIIGFGRSNFGIIGRLVSGFSIFLFGSYWGIGLVLLFVYGAYMTLNREKLYLFNRRLLGVYIALIGALVLSHINILINNNYDAVKTLSSTIELFLDINSSSNIVGGGIIGGIFIVIFEKLLSIPGTKIVSYLLMVFGVLIFFNISMVDSIKFFIKQIKKLFGKKGKKIEEENPTVIADSKEDDKKIITNIEELTQKHIEKDDLNNVEVINYDQVKVVGDYKLPSLELLDSPKKDKKNNNVDSIKYNVEKLEKVLLDFEIVGKVVGVNVGPSVTQYEIELKSGTKVNKVLGINREIALSLAARDVRIQAPIPGKSTIGIELPNQHNTPVSLKEVLIDIPRSMDTSKLCVPLGKNIMGKSVIMEINKTPHLLVAGTTGSGKSSCINSIIISILMRTTPDEVKMVLIDPKKVEMGVYNGEPHLLMPVVTDPKKAAVALIKMVSEMDSRYELFSETGTKNINDYNRYIEKNNEGREKLPFIVIIIDELADLMLVAGKEVEDSILRITQMARAAGIHLIVATQRPSTDVITGIIKANIPSKIAFTVSSSIDSRTIIDMSGAEKLLGKGDMLFFPIGEIAPTRIQGAYVSDEEVARVVDYIVKQQKAKYSDKYLLSEEKATKMHEDDTDEYDDPLYNDIVEFIVRNGKASASLLQRKYKLGYNRAARIIDLLEERGIIGPQNGSKPREVLIKLEEDNDYGN